VNPMNAAGLGGSDFNFKHYVGIAERRKWWIILTAVGVSVMTAVASLLLPNVWRSEAVIMVEPQKVSAAIVRPAASSDLSDRIAMIRQQVISQTRLKRLIETLGLYPELRGKMGEQDIITKMQQDIEIEMVQQAGLRLNAFRIAYQGKDPVIVAQVANQLASEFISENLKTREQQFYGTAEFLDDELAKTKKQIDDKETQLAEIRSKYTLDLPESQQYHLESLTSLRTQLAANQEQIDRLQQEKTYLRSLESTTAPTIDLDASSAANPYESQVSKLKAKLSELRTRYGPQHPDVRTAEAELHDAEQRAAAAEKKIQAQSVNPATVSVPNRGNPVIDAQIAQIDKQIQDKQAQQKPLQDQIAFHVSKLQGIPIFQQKIADVMRDYDTLRAHYQDLLNRKLAADTATSMENRQQGERFVILDPALVPDKPYGPKRLLICLAGILGGILGGFGLAILVEFSDESVRTEREVMEILGAPNLGSVPLMLDKHEKKWKRITASAMVAATVVVSAGVGTILGFAARRLG
jgi:succinoglycan biosynthesis transport protein ExoP